MIRSVSADEAGYSLVELVVAMGASVAVLFALATILIGTTRQTQRTLTRVSATRQARTAIADIENELHSACVGGSQAPILAGSTATTLEFVSYYGDAATPTPVYHVLSWSSSAQTLTDSSYSSSTLSSSTVTSTDQLLSNVTEQTNSGTAVPVFRYYAYTATGMTDAGGAYYYVPDGTTLNPVTGTMPNAPELIASSGLTGSQATATVEVSINLSVGPDSDRANNGSLVSVENDQINDAVSLRFTTPPDEGPSETGGTVPPGYGPCE